MRPARAQNPSPSLDSLLDTMTNVVGILIILLALTQVGIGDAVRRAFADTDAPLAHPSDHAINAALREQAALDAALRDARARYAELEPHVAGRLGSLQQVRRAIDELRAALDDGSAADVSRDRLQPLIADRTTQLDRLAAQVRLAEAEHARLRAIAAATPAYVSPTVHLLTLPNPREAPDRFTPLTVLVQGGRLYLADEPTLRRIAADAVARSGARQPDGRLDCSRLLAAFNAHPRGDRWCDLAVEAHAFVPYLVIRPRPGAGEDRRQLERFDSDYRRALDAAAGRRRYLQFLVASDSFETYLAARAVADRVNVPAGWEPVESARDLKLRLTGDAVCVGHPEPSAPQPPQPPPLPNGGNHPPPRKTLPGLAPQFKID